VSLSELRAAGIVDPRLQRSYLRCRDLNARHGKTYYLATLLLPPDRRPFVHALYGFARYADDVVDSLDPDVVPERRAQYLYEWGGALFDDLRRGHSEDPIRAAVVDTVLRWEIPQEYFEAFLTSMAMDLTTDSYETYDDLMVYVYGSAEVIGLQMLPILGAAPQAEPFARRLGTAFQLANFIRDVDEDLDRGRIYLPLEDLARFDVSPEHLRQRRLTPQIRAALQYQIVRVRDLERASRPGIAMLPSTTRDCVDVARELYCGIVDAVEDIDYDVFNQRASVGMGRRLAVALPGATRAVWARGVRPGPKQGLAIGAARPAGAAVDRGGRARPTSPA